MSKQQPKIEKLLKETNDFGTQYTDACTQSSKIFMKGCEEMFGTFFSLAQATAEKQSKFAKEAMGVKTINEFAEVQNKIAQANFDDFVNGATKISEMSTKLLTESAEPVNAQMTKVMKKATESMAA